MMWMPWKRRQRMMMTAARMRAEHERFLTLALLSGDRYPRIPSRPVQAGGYSKTMARPSGTARTQQWWTIALNRVD